MFITKGQIIEIFQDIINPNSPKITKLLTQDNYQLLNPMLLTQWSSQRYYIPKSRKRGEKS